MSVVAPKSSSPLWRCPIATKPYVDPFPLKEVLQKLDVSQRRLAKELGVQPSHVHRYYTGRYQPTWWMACKIADTLGVSVGVFHPGDPAHAAFFGEEGVPA